MTRQEYDILREHGERLLAIDESLRELPNQIADRMEIKVTKAIASCREQSEERHAHIDYLWERHQRKQGARGLLAAVSKRTSFIIGSVGGVAGVAAVLFAILY